MPSTRCSTRHHRCPRCRRGDASRGRPGARRCARGSAAPAAADGGDPEGARGDAGRILSAHATEYALLALIAATLAILLGGFAAWLITTRLMDLPFTLSCRPSLQALGVSMALVALIGGLGTWRVLRAPPVPYLRSE